MTTNAFPFSVPLQLYLASVGPLPARAQFLPSLPGSAAEYDIAVVFNDAGESPAGMYLFTGSTWQLCLPYDVTNDYVISGGSINVYFDLITNVTPQTGAVVYRNGVKSSDTTLTANPHITWATIFTNPTTGGSVAGVASFNTRTGAVVLSTADVDAVYSTPTATSGTLGGVKIGANVTVQSDGTISVAAPTAAYVLPAATALALGGVKQGTGVTIASDGTLNAAVTSVAGRTGVVVLAIGDVPGAAPLASPTFTGTATAAALTVTGGTQVVAITASGLVTANGGLTVPAGQTVSMAAATAVTAPTVVTTDSTTNVATTAFVHAAITAGVSGVTSFNTRTGAVVLTGADVTSAGGALLASPTFTGTVTVAALTASGVVNLAAGTVTVPTIATAADSTTSAASTAFVHAAITAGGFLTTTVAGTTYAPIASPTFTGVPIGTTQSTIAGTTQLATSAYVANFYAPLASPTLTGTVTGVNFNASGNVNVQGNLSSTSNLLSAGPTNSGVAIGGGPSYALVGLYDQTLTADNRTAEMIFITGGMQLRFKNDSGNNANPWLAATGGYALGVTGITSGGTAGAPWSHTGSFNVQSVTSGGNNLVMTGTNSTGVPTLSTAGAAVNISMNIATKGSGGINLQASTAVTGNFSVTGAVTGFPYDLIVSYSGPAAAPVLAASTLVYEMKMTRSVTFPAGAGISLFSASATATAQTVLSIMQNVTQVGTITYAAGSITGVVNFTSATVYTAGQSLYIQGPTTADTTLAGVFGTLSGTLS